MIFTVLSQLTLIRFIQVYIALSIVFIFFLYLIVRIIKNDPKKLKIILVGFFLSEDIGIFINFIYFPLTDPEILIFLNFLTNFFVILGPIFLMIFCLTIFKGEEKINKSTQLLIIFIYGMLISFMVLIPNGVIINADTGWYPHWNLTLFIYVMVIMTTIAIIPSIYFEVKIYQILLDESLRKKWKIFIIGSNLLFILLYGIFFSNTLHNSTFRTIWALISLFLALTGSYLVYYGIGSKFEEP